MKPINKKMSTSVKTVGGCIATIVALVVVAEPRLSAQQSLTPYVSAAGGPTLEQGAYQDASRGSKIGVGGQALSASVGAGLHLASRVKVGVEASLGGPFLGCHKSPRACNRSTRTTGVSIHES
jgi:hypothetical protein